MKNRKNILKTNNLGISDIAFNRLLVMMISLIFVVVLCPLLYVISASLSSGSAVTAGRVLLWPVDFTTVGYRLVFKYKQIWSGYANTLFYVVVVGAFEMINTTLVAYVLSRRNFQARGLVTILYLIPLWFGGGMIPTYVLASKLHLTNSRWGYVIMFSGVMASNMVIMRTYFQSSIPQELHEAAQMDGVTDFGDFFKITLPLAKPVLSVIALYSVVGNWNSYFAPMLYLRDMNIQPLQLVIRKILVATQIDAAFITDKGLVSEVAQSADIMKFALIVVSTAPMLCLFPFVQKFFEKGVMMGSLKG